MKVSYDEWENITFYADELRIFTLSAPSRVVEAGIAFKMIIGERSHADHKHWLDGFLQLENYHGCNFYPSNLGNRSKSLHVQLDVINDDIVDIMIIFLHTFVHYSS